MYVNSGKEECVQLLSVEFPRVFSKIDSEKPIRNVKVSLNVLVDVQPNFCKPVTYALGEEVGCELDRLELKGIIIKVKILSWESPMVIAPMPNGSIRMIVDFKVTLNKFLIVDQHAMSIPEDILNNFTVCTVFCRQGLFEAYLQLRDTQVE